MAFIVHIITQICSWLLILFLRNYRLSLFFFFFFLSSKPSPESSTSFYLNHPRFCLAHFLSSSKLCSLHIPYIFYIFKYLLTAKCRGLVLIFYFRKFSFIVTKYKNMICDECRLISLIVLKNEKFRRKSWHLVRSLLLIETADSHSASHSETRALVHICSFVLVKPKSHWIKTILVWPI